jgi:hypothetical protein
MKKNTTIRRTLLGDSLMALLTCVSMGTATADETNGSSVVGSGASGLEQKKLSLWGRDIGFQPRVYGGVMYYDYEEDATAASAGPIPSFENVETLSRISGSKYEVKTTLPILGVGGTFFIDRFFIDLYTQHAFSQSDNGNQTIYESRSAIIGPTAGASITSQLDAHQDNDVDRTEGAVSVGYSLTDNLALYAGYRRADTNFDIKQSGQLVTDVVTTFGASKQTADLSSDIESEFEQDGPFVGFAYGVLVNKGMFNDLISFDLAVAFLDGDVTQKNTNVEFKNVKVNEQQAPDFTAPDAKFRLEGNADGLNLGLYIGGDSRL